MGTTKPTTNTKNRGLPIMLHATIQAAFATAFQKHALTFNQKEYRALHLTMLFIITLANHNRIVIKYHLKRSLLL